MNAKHLESLRPYLIGERPKADGEWDMFCPLHEDTNRSASINFDKGVWVCHKGCQGGYIQDLLLKRAAWTEPPKHRLQTSPSGARRGKVPRELDADAVRQWHMRLRKQTSARMKLKRKRGLSEQSIRRFDLGWDPKQQAYTIPIRLADDSLVNVRFYDMNPPDDRRKMWSVPGHGSPELFPFASLMEDTSEIIVCEGEMDAMLTIQHGYTAVTRTGSAITWDQAWGHYFKGRVVYVCHDMDKAGQQGNQIVGRALARWAKEVKVIHLPYPITEKHGKDLTDFWNDKHDKRDFRKLMDKAKPLSVEVAPLDESPRPSQIIDAFNAVYVGRPLDFNVTIKGRKEPGYSLPAKFCFTCEVETEASRCGNCPLNGGGADKEISVAANDPMLLEMIDVSKKQVRGVLKEYHGRHCKNVDVDITDRQSVEIVYGRPSVDAAPSADGAGDYKTIKITSSGKHDTMPNTTVQVTGSLYPNPRTQNNEFLAWDIHPVRTSIDSFEPDAQQLRALRKFQPGKRQGPLQKVAEIAREMSLQVTQIYGRPEMHALMDLCWHSALSFKVGADKMERGWLDVLIVGDTRTGKSEAAMRLAQHYLAGEIVSCESATYAGIVGGAQQMNGSQWVVTWGAIPLNDRRLVVLDEVGGLSREEIAKMSSVRSSGVAELTMIAQERTHARTRLLWLGNPRNGRMSDYTYGVQAISPLIGNPEDIARFDVAMSVHSDEVATEEINTTHQAPPVRYDSESCHALLRWVWSRQPDQIIWTPEASSSLLLAAQDMSRKYIEIPPLVQGANVRYKLARVATAMAGRTFSCDPSYQRLVVTRRHVTDAMAFINRLYSMPSFGYMDISSARINDLEDAQTRKTKIKRYLVSTPGLSKLLRGTGTFTRMNLEEVCDVSREQANGIIKTLWESNMIRKDGEKIMAEPALQEILRSEGRNNGRVG